MRWRWTTPKTRGAAPRTKTPRARRSLRMEIAQVRDPAGWDPESSRQDSERPLSTRRQLRPAGRAGRGEREGRRLAPGPPWHPNCSRGAAQLLAGPSWRGGAEQGAGLDSSSSRTLLGSVLDPPRPWDLWVVPRAIRRGKCPASYLGDAGNASSPHTADFLYCTFAALLSVCGLSGAEGTRSWLV